MTSPAGRGRSMRGWLWIAALLLAAILVPFALWDEAITSWSRAVVAGDGAGAWIASVIGGLLAVDVLLPVPSSILSTAAGYRFGFLAGAVVSWGGMTVGCALAYAVGSGLGHGPSERLVGAEAMTRAREAMRRNAVWVLAVLRPVPVLAEASVLMAGISRMPLRPFVVVTTLANLGVSIAYAWVGSRSAEVGSFLLAFGGAMLLPGVAMFLARRFRLAGAGAP